jgi:hypothetical protein
MTEWEYEPAFERWTLHTFNDAGHLRALGVRRPERRADRTSRG